MLHYERSVARAGLNLNAFRFFRELKKPEPIIIHCGMHDLKSYNLHIGMKCADFFDDAVNVVRHTKE